ncbi:putative ABC transport system permease protein [Xylanibacter ruminicola]|uniref:Putative ABC transport system permease protein n=1 Tax=Xylanibacter ruminicola TaxID=839 RepID=A0A1M7MG57_XYLRU|nr:ABC transporter permease [Xylanibacter ruminicola]SHM89788.1 putative ABC transport system permease protein [Xylanibacter ruminicola]
MKSYFRFLSRNKLYTLINVVGLVVSLMFIILLGDYTWRQYSIDSWHKNADRIYLVGDQTSFSMWPQAGDRIKDMCPEIEQKCCVMSVRGKIKYGRQEVKDGENENGIIMVADSTFFQFFDFELETGSRQTALNSPDKCVITERLAHRLFGDKNPIGESVQIVGEYDVEPGNTVYDSTLVYTVSAVAKDFDHTVLPNETQIIANMKRYPQMLSAEFPSYSYAFSNAGACKVFFMLRPGMTLDNKKKTIDNYIVNNYFIPFGEYKVSVTPLKEVMFAPQNDGKGLQKGDKTRLHILITAVLALLFFAITNYINLTVANTGFRSKEMATRRLFGSSQRMIAWKLIAESTLMVALAFAIGLALALCFQDDAISLFKGKIAITDDINIVSVSLCLGGIFLVGIVSGLLPSWQMTRYQPIDIVKGNFRFRSKMVLGKVFIILQNVITVTMLTASLVIWLQLHHLIHAPLGFNTENLFYIISPEGKEQVVRSKLEKMPFVERIGTFNGCTFTQFHTGVYIIVRDDKFVSMFETDMDKTTFELLGLQIKHNHGTSNDGIYLNEEALRQLDNKIDARELGWYDGGKEPVAGVLEEFHSVNVLSPIQPFAIRVQKDKEFPMFLVKTNGDKQAKAAFDEMMKKLNGSAENRVQSIEESIAETFKDQQHTLKLITLFTLIAIVVSVLGFIGMSLFFIRQRQKDIGIRKIMGSTSSEVMMLMLRTFCVPLLVSFVMAIPLSWYVMNDWLSNFSYRISLSPWIFVATCAFSLLVAVLSVSIQIMKAVCTNPVESVKTE